MDKKITREEWLEKAVVALRDGLFKEKADGRNVPPVRSTEGCSRYWPCRLALKGA